MWRRRIRVLRSIALRTLVQRLSLVLFLFCLVNAAWSILGGWSISFGGESFHHYSWGRRESGIYSCGGHFVVAIRNSHFVASGLRPPDWQSRQPIRQQFSWSITANMNISPLMFQMRTPNGIIDDRPRMLLPGLLLNWQDQSRGEWHNRGIAVHWLWLAALVAAVPALALVRYRRRADCGQCGMCGYDLRATPGRCPECGAVTALGWPAT
jgi:hypothetical protein